MKEKEKILLILRAQTGDKFALNKLLEYIQLPLYNYIFNMLTNKSHALDILQEVFILIYKKLPGLKCPEYFNSWVYRITTREIFRIIKKNRKRYGYFDDKLEPDNFPENKNDGFNEISISESLETLIKYLPPASRAVITLHYKNELSLNEIADVLDISIGTVKSRLSYGLKLLRDKIELSPELKEIINF